MCLVEVKLAVSKLGMVIGCQDQLKANSQPVMLPIKSFERAKPARFYHEKNVRPVHKRKGIVLEMMLLQQLVEKWRVGDPPIGAPEKMGSSLLDGMPTKAVPAMTLGQRIGRLGWRPSTSNNKPDVPDRKAVVVNWRCNSIRISTVRKNPK